MDPSVLCSEDQTRPAICACFCRFPLPTLCSACLSKHQIDPSVFQHFHLPTYASQCIDSQELHAQYSPWLTILHSAYGVLRENEEEITRFEDKVEAARLEAVHQLDQSVDEIRQRLAELKAAYKNEVETAIAETNRHAMGQWNPESGSLAARIWNYDSSDPASLRVVRLGIGAGSLNQTIRLSIETTLPSLAGFDTGKEELEKEMIQWMRSELERSRKEQAGAIVKNKELTEENEKLKRDGKALCEQLEAAKKSSAAEIQILRDENAALRANSRQLGSQQSIPASDRLAGARHISESDVQTAANLLGKGVAEKTAFRYMESARLLQQSWDLLKSSPEKQTAAVGAALGEVLGVHLGKNTEAMQVIYKSLEIEMMLDPISEEVMKLSNLTAEIAFLQGKNGETEAICVNTLRAFSTSNYNPEHFWVAVFYLTYAYCEQNKHSQAETLVAQWVQKEVNTDSRLIKLLNVCVRCRLLLAKECSEEAESLLSNAQELAASDFPVSIYAAMIMYWFGLLYKKMNQHEKSKGKLSEGERIFSTHYCNSIQTAHSLMWLSTVCNDMEQRELAVQKRLEAHRIYEAHFPTNINTANNLESLGDLYREMGQRELALQKRLEAHRIYEAHFPTDIGTAHNLTRIGLLHYELDRLEDAERASEQARFLYAARYPTALDSAINLYNLAVFNEKRQKIDSAINFATSASEISAFNKSEAIGLLVAPLLTRLKGIKKLIE